MLLDTCREVYESENRRMASGHARRPKCREIHGASRDGAMLSTMLAKWGRPVSGGLERLLKPSRDWLRGTTVSRNVVPAFLQAQTLLRDFSTRHRVRACIQRTRLRGENRPYREHYEI
ncbi:hypothetical protein KM043_011996 [Ampulex compressa]|nr:hypothetical protein KM043_011996 [Ampulex compressa]